MSQNAKIPGNVSSKWLILAVLSAALFMINLDVTIVNIALPDIMDKLSASLADGEWILNAYVLVFAVLLITMGRLGDMFGRKKLFTGGLALFTGASLLCGLAPGIEWLITARVLQAAGGAAMMPATLSILNITFHRGQRGLAMGIWGASAGAAAALGPLIGGLLVGSLGWQWIFLVNLPIGLAALVAARRIIPESSDPDAGKRIDFAGIVTASLALGTLTYALVEGQSFGWTSPVILGLFGISLLAGVAFIVAEAKSAAPLIELSLFRNLSFSAGNILGLLLMFCLVGGIFLSVMYLQMVRQFTPMHAGLLVLPLPLALMIISPLAGRLADHVPMRWAMSAGMLIVAGAFFFLKQFGMNTGWVMIALPMAGAGIGLGLVMAPLGTVVMGSAPVANSGAASGVLTTMRQVGATLGISALGAVLQFQLVANLTYLFGYIPFMPQSAKDAMLEAVSKGGMTGASFSDAPSFLQELIGQIMREQFNGAISTAMTVTMFVAAAGAAVALFINYKPSKRYSVVNHS
ncbi:DHA2 family efflux MFS transporter permease subunit [Dehalogenimonas etheniformans]|uniref:MFS transporter n=1 Tax=Dehalogenimonas etheniformans TaxID=1536648 RepID=A0A2P5P8Z1_9CHLR|nr:DHA2 family efflux MFS transporter permease subunit [Dehalogenimonas etheniformans]PPD58768.1 MFS transporter [Dehalogenimonas etheniformans]QNT76461.1 DHA2 family efflux MFS transporter permease subunit [Dehalogenimonas etheniformans]